MHSVFLGKFIVSKKNIHLSIAFTTFASTGFGIIIWTVFFAFFEVIPPDLWFAVSTSVFAYFLIIIGSWCVMSNPRYRRVFYSKIRWWKTSWEIRQALCLVCGCITGLLFFIGWIAVAKYNDIWLFLGGLTSLLFIGALMGMAMSFVAHRTILPWSNPHTVRIYISMGLWTGIVWLNMFTQIFNFHTPVIGIVLIIIGIATLIFKRKYWIFIDTYKKKFLQNNNSSKDKNRFQPRMIEYCVYPDLTKNIDRLKIEMLRRRAFLLYFLLPFCAATMPVELTAWVSVSASIIGAFSVVAGVAIERWLFFAEAKHFELK
ncbi:MAG: hypothetical protein CMM44_11845 [Rhodospirillaceae bacterium]|nr:hypothetical protein [Rhodospirillaceae bacterium]|tara:strand:- start:6355 stop:7302 length:948 start_codon:yes stop_codon:yes gene_type:complete